MSFYSTSMFVSLAETNGNWLRQMQINICDTVRAKVKLVKLVLVAAMFQLGLLSVKLCVFMYTYI